MPRLYYFPSEDCCPRKKLRVQGGWRHEWYAPESIVPREVVRGPFSKPLLVASTPFVLFNDADSYRKLGHTRTGIPDPWAEYLAQQIQGHSQLGEENLAVVDNAYRKWGESVCQGIPDPWRNRSCFLEAGFDELQKCGNISSCKYPGCSRRYGNNALPHTTRNQPRENGNTPVCDLTNCPRKHYTSLTCKCTPEIPPEPLVVQVQQPQTQTKTTQTRYIVNPENVCSCDLQPVQTPLDIQSPRTESSIKPQKEPQRKCPGCPLKRRGFFNRCHCKEIESKPTSPPIRESKKKRSCPISKCFRKAKKTQNTADEPPGRNVTNPEPNSALTGDKQNLLLMCWQNCKCNFTPCKLVCTNANLGDYQVLQVPVNCQCSHTNNTPNDSANLFPSTDVKACNLAMIQACPFDKTTGSSKKNDSLYPCSAKEDKLHTPRRQELDGRHGNKQKTNFTNKQNSEHYLQKMEDETEKKSYVEDERNKGRY